MRVIITDLKTGVLPGFGDAVVVDAYGVYTDSENEDEARFAVVEVFRKELFVAVEITANEDGVLAGEYIDYYQFREPVPLLARFTVDWTYLSSRGFCKLKLWAPELANQFGGSFEKTVKRFWLKKREESKNEQQ